MIPDHGGSIDSSDVSIFAQNNTSNFSLAILDSFQSQNLIDNLTTEKDQENSTISFFYDDQHKVERVWTKSPKARKDFYPSYQVDGKWIKGLGEASNWLPYRSQDFSLAKDKYILFSEGEKATEYARARHFISTCILGSGANNSIVIKKAIDTAKSHGIKGFIYFYDNDKTGLDKAKKVLEIATENKFNCLCYSILDLMPDAKESYDLADYLIANPSLSTIQLESIFKQVVKDNKPLILEIKQQEIINREINFTAKKESSKIYDKYIDAFTLPIDAMIPLECCLSLVTKELLKGVGQGEREIKAQIVIAELLGTENYLMRINQSYQGSAMQLFQEYCDNCNPPLSASESNKIVKWAQKQNRTPSLSEDKIINCIAAWYWNNSNIKDNYYSKKIRESTVTKLNKTLKVNNESNTSENLLPKVINDLITQLSKPDISESERQKELSIFCSQYGINSYTLQKAIDSRIKQDFEQSEIESLDLDNLMSVPKMQLNLNYLFGDYFGEVLKESARRIPTNPDAMVTILLPMIASVIGTRSQIIVNSFENYTQPFILRTMLVGNSGTKKSPIARFVLKPLQDLNIAYAKQYKLDILSYEEHLEEWNSLSKNERGQKPKKPIQKRLIIQDSTFDGMIKKHLENPNGFLCFVDELIAYFKRQNKFNRTGSGDDAQRDLESYNGDPIIKTRADSDNDIFLEKSAISITGTIQESALEQLFNNIDDSTGITARWLIWNGLLPDGLAMDRSKEDTGYYILIQSLIDGLMNHSCSDLLVDDQAYKVWQKWQHGIIKAIKHQKVLQVGLKMAKMEGEVIRIAGVLHYFHLILNPDLITNPVVINAEIMLRAIEIGNYYLKHFAYAATKYQKDQLDSQLLKILEVVKKKGECTANEIRRSVWELKDFKVNEVSELIIKLIDIKKLERLPSTKGLRVKILEK